MPDNDAQQPGNYPTRPAFDQAAAALGISGSDAHMDELYTHLQGVLSATASLRHIDVAGAEPDMAFIPAPGEASHT